MDRIGNPIPFNAAHASRAYAKPMTVRPLAAPPNTAGVERPDRTVPAGTIRPATEPRPTPDPTRLVAAEVGPIDLSRDVGSVGGNPAPASAYAMYRHPADQNLAATGVELGRRLDVEG